MIADQSRLLVYQRVVENPGRSGPTYWKTSDEQKALMVLLGCGALKMDLNFKIHARLQVSPLSREDHTDCWPVCNCFKD